MLLKLFFKVYSLMMNILTAFHLFHRHFSRDYWVPNTILTIDSWVIHGPWPCEVCIWVGRKQNNNIQFMFNATIFVVVIRKVAGTQWNKGECLPGRVGTTFVPEVAAMRDWTEHRTTSLLGLCAHHTGAPGRELAEGAPTSIPQLPAGPGRGRCLSWGKGAFCLHKCAICLPSPPRGVLVLSHIQGQYCLEVALVAGHWNDRECWIAPVFTVRPRSFGLYFLTTRVS